MSDNITINIKKSLVVTVLVIIAVFLIVILIIQAAKPTIKASDLVGKYQNNDITNAFMGIAEQGIVFFEFPSDSPTPLTALNGIFHLKDWDLNAEEYSFDYNRENVSYKGTNYIVYLKFTKKNEAVKCQITSETETGEKSGSAIFYK
ncbi:hypothetical protein [Brachyspira hyodysenteriae]|uniref:hypothetical protein n=1 Tax=Brachyspira hyodysenteriae TaxID=159 RepID=UPI00063DB95A|nr:hypothetical protein [Brachyspira hyodysenteriae]KLI62001.1 hypothetical protein SZ46_03945 [Brachyspira hyodysenteriae]